MDMEYEDQLSAASKLDRAGRLDEAREKVRDFNFTHAAATRIAAKIESFLMEAAILRHRDDVPSLNRARELAAQSHRLAQLPACTENEHLRAHTALELASCALATGRHEEALSSAQQWTGHDDYEHAGRAWAVVGETHLAVESYAKALPALLNAVAEYARGRDNMARLQVRISVAAVLSRSGRLPEAATVLDADEAFWVSSENLRLAAEYRLVRGENLQRQGFLREAIASLDAAWDLLERSSGMETTKVRVQLQRAESLLEWGQSADADDALKRATHMVEELGVPEQRIERPGAVPPPSPARRVTVQRSKAMTGGLHTQLAHRVAELKDRLGKGEESHPRLNSPRRLRSPGIVAEVRGVVDSAQAGGINSDESIRYLVSQVERLQSLPGQDRAEATVLVEAGSILREAPGIGLMVSERLIRRAQARLALLEGMGIWRARADVELARTLQRGGDVDGALAFAVSGVQELDRQRHRMDRRDYRRNWLATEIHPSLELAISLAVETGDEHLAADLIVFSRAAGVVVAQAPDQTTGELSDVPLLPVPKLHYIDGRTSKLGSEQSCRFC